MKQNKPDNVECDQWYPVKNSDKKESRKQLVITVEVNDHVGLAEVEHTLLLGWIERWPGFATRIETADPKGIEVQEVHSCAICGFAQSCQQIRGEDCHS
jgi:hypothetical protein